LTIVAHQGEEMNESILFTNVVKEGGLTMQEFRQRLIVKQSLLVVILQFFDQFNAHLPRFTLVKVVDRFQVN
jgi:hypothetical protein